MKEKILKTLLELGFILEELDGIGYGFKYEGINYILMESGNDEDFLSLAVPSLVRMEDIGKEHFYMLIDKINSTLKYIKANSFGDSLWLFYERELYGGENLEELISRMIVHLEAGAIFTHSCEEEPENGDANDDNGSGDEMKDEENDNQ